ncbi:hypothetical protein COCC4DRAFT_50335 [Bipolaris maydis ATCC 48331]|uniref:Uncharacterized protein n=2 Tax=Cochliobolus heterostrophus TaxID=5016 RepID=M2UKZ7_COCH5|nr:uncharacterized protein COCC4DRAFT_50335 [Bipolaris maydis ATCC 48331]EMD88663.1 hypothetical protein COCHEDRAFT_1181864 [Bipolaris maydis C5]KAJ5028741.1 hypothetical protein J3E73DRAFT_207769 [Bipolaris maydis]ENI05620.1 hypothetical protein COCC4DRAFT_50335 [Bipolaris maydis ATCC 48331]KAJ5063532.1 hypothetical protein J3E74DRAFT_472478 [Bipolaris maydis]KAJ6199791.1 hypothetical protein J3E72DRAFT_213772 [Bipolaris maydis]
MAHLKQPPRASAATEISSQSSSSHTSDFFHPAADDQAAIEQLLTESLTTYAPPPPPSAVALGADLLNAARIDHRHSSPVVGMALKNRAGKLKRRNLIPKSARTNLAVRGDVYEIELSPEKGNYVLPERVNKKPLTIVKKKTRAEPTESPASIDPPMGSTPPQFAPVGTDSVVVDTAKEEIPSRNENSHANVPGDVKIEESLDNGKPRCKAVFYKYDKITGTTYKQCLRPGTGQTDDSFMCGIHLSKPPTVRCEEMVVSDNVTTQCYRAAFRVTANGPRCPTCIEQQGYETTPRDKRKSAPIHQEDHPSKVLRRKSERMGKPTSSGKTKDQARDLQEESSNPASASKRGRPRKDGSSASTELNRQLPKRTRKSKSSPAISQEVPNVPEDLPENIATVFSFLDLEARQGTCQTKRARKILHMCEKYCANFQDGTHSIDAVTQDATKIQKTLQQTPKEYSTEIIKEDQFAFKNDAYSFVFRSLTLYLRDLYNWLVKTHKSATESLESLRVITPLMQEIVAFNDAISHWNVTVPQRQKGDRVVKDVQTRLIAPLRRASQSLSVRLGQLEEAEERREQYEKIKRRIQERRDAQSEETRAIEAMEERKKRWQDLHIVRMQCEPDVYRRRKLFHTKFEDLVERDANGIVFERLPIFKPRSTPPHSQVSELADEVDWTEDEEIAVLEGLQYCAGPCVFEKIFKTYCDPRSSHPRGGDLRSRTVAEIVSKARWIRSMMLTLRQESGEPVEDWVTGIPILP